MSDTKVCDCIYGDGACEEHSDTEPVANIRDSLVWLVTSHTGMPEEESNINLKAVTTVEADIDRICASEQLQQLVNLNVRLEDEFVRRDLTTDNLPKGYRKMTDKEIYVKVLSQMITALQTQLEGETHES